MVQKWKRGTSLLQPSTMMGNKKCTPGSSCNCNKWSELNYAEGNTTETVIMGVAPPKIQSEGVEMGVAAEDGGCKCGSNCTCDPCNC